MLSTLSSHVANRMIARGAIQTEDRETYEYGVYILLTSAIHVATVLLLGLVSRMLLESIVFYGAYAILRKFAGGYHASTSVRCYLLSLVVVAGALFAASYANTFYILLFSSLLLPLAAGVIFIMSPVEDGNKPLEGSEAKHYRKAAAIILAMELILAVVFSLLGLYRFTFMICLSLTTLAIMLIMGQIKNMRAKAT